MGNRASLPTDLGINGAFIGQHNGVILIAGGANFPNKPVWEGGQKQWYNTIYALSKDGKGNWEVISSVQKLPKPLAYGVAVSTLHGVLCVGGESVDGFSNAAFLLKWDSKTKQVKIQLLPEMPYPLAHMGGDVVGDKLYLVGGQKKPGGNSTDSFLSLTLSSDLETHAYRWEKLVNFEGAPRIQPVVVSQNDGKEDLLYVFSGAKVDPNTKPSYEMLTDVYAYSSKKKQWFKKNPIPNNETPGITGGYVAAAPAYKTGDAHIVILGGAGGPKQYLYERLAIEDQISQIDDQQKENITSLRNKQNELLKKTSFSNTVWAYHTITDTWVKRGDLPFETPVVTTAIMYKNEVVLAGGEVSPGVRTNAIYVGHIDPYKPSFGWANYLTLGVYLSLMILMGWYFSRRNKSTDDYFLGGGRIPWWAAGLSIYATMLSAITYLSQPALAYAFDWQAYLGYFTVLLIVPIVITFYLPFFRRLKITTAYEYLEKRFHIVVRVFGSASFVLFQLARMGIVVYLPALAISTVTGIDIYMAIILMGLLAILYTVMGGIEAVIWTDVIQVIVLIAGLIIGLIYIGTSIGDVGYIFETAWKDSKLQLFDFRLSSTEVVTWSLFLGSFASNFAPYTTDQAVVQRYLTTSDEKQARKSIWMNGIITIPAGLLIFSMGTFLYVYFKEHPDFLSVGMQNDGVFPLFIADHLPPGIAGLVIAGIYSASMSSLDSSMHSISTVFTVDYFKRFSSK